MLEIYVMMTCSCDAYYLGVVFIARKSWQVCSVTYTGKQRKISWMVDIHFFPHNAMLMLAFRLALHEGKWRRMGRQWMRILELRITSSTLFSVMNIFY